MHTLVFRSLKRTHDMFLSCQGMLPPIDEEALVNFEFLVIYLNNIKLCSVFREKIKKLVKARDCYGLVFDKVERNKINMKKSQPNPSKSDIVDTYKDNFPLAISKKTFILTIKLFILLNITYLFINI